MKKKNGGLPFDVSVKLIYTNSVCLLTLITLPVGVMTEC